MTLEHPLGSPGPMRGTRWVGEFPCCPGREFFSDLPRDDAFALHFRIHHPNGGAYS